MSRRPLGATLSPDDRLVAFERRIRDYQAAIGELESAMEALHTGTDAEGHEVTRGHGQAAVWRAFVALQELNARPFRRRETVASTSTAAEPTP